MTPPERPEVAAGDAMRQIKALARQHEGWDFARIDVIVGEYFGEITRRADAAEPLRGALEAFAEFADPSRIVPESHVITQGSPMARRQLTMGDCYRARAALEATAPSTPEPALDPRVVEAFDLLGGMWSWSEENGYFASSNGYALQAGRLLREVVGRPAKPPALTSEPRAAAPQEGAE